MALSPGTRLGSYEILAPIGAGGMGEVYRARDTKLGREVAVKVLPEVFSRDEEKLARFQREAHLLASLNHPNIATIHGLEESEGRQFLVMELVEGETLAERLVHGLVPVDEALPLFQHIAEGLEAAHEKGIIHRDLKPSNIKITPEGKPKILDFGLAKALAGEAVVQDLSQSPTLTRDATETGVLLGTAPYMSPEQARGKPVDKRTDVWAFGCCLYEALTGKPAFLGETVSDTLARILEQQPDWEALPSKTPAPLRRLLRRCLEKDYRRRLQAIGDARVEIEELLAGEPEEKAVMVAPASAWKRLLPWALVTVLLMMFGGFLWTRGRDRSQTRPATRLDLVLPAEAPMASGGSLALSPDGRRLVYPAEVGGDWQLHLRHTETGETRSIPGTRGGDTPFFSPDGEWLGFFAGGKLRKVSLAGGEPVVLADAPIGLGGAWAPDDTIYFNTHEGEGLSRVPATGGQAQRVTQAQDWWPDILPGQEALLFIGHGAGRGFWNGIHSLRDGEVRRLLAPAYYARYVPTGHLVYAERGKLLAVAFDLAALVVTSEPVTLLEDLRTAGNFGGAPFALSQDGLLVYAPGQDIEFASLVWADHQGSVEPLGLEPGLFGESFSISPDGTQVAVPIREGSGSDIWLYDIARGTRTRFTFGLRDDPRARSQTPRWTPDGRHIVYTSLVFSSPEDEGPRAHLFWKPADGNREAVRLTPDDAPRQLGPDSFSPDGSVLTFFSNSPGTGFDLGLLRLDGIDPYAGKLPKAEFLLQTRYGEAWARFSPDGRWIAYMSNESGRYEVYVRPFPGPGPRVQISTDGGAEALWHPSGRQLFYRTFGTRFYVVDVRLSPEFEAGRPRLLFEGPFIHIPGYCVDISPDGERFLTLHNPQNFEPNPTLTVITNFFDELRRLVPADN